MERQDCKHLYVRFKPKKISDFFGIEYLHKRIKYLIDHYPMKILISGIYGSGKTSLAEAILMRMHCEQPNGLDACRECYTCKLLINTPWWEHCDTHSAQGLDRQELQRISDSLIMSSTFVRDRTLFLDDLDLMQPSLNLNVLEIMNQYDFRPMIFTVTDHTILPDPLLQRCYHLHIRPYSIEALSEWIRKICSEIGVEIESNEALEQLIHKGNSNPRILSNILEELYAKQATVNIENVNTEELNDLVNMLRGDS